MNEQPAPPIPPLQPRQEGESGPTLPQPTPPSAVQPVPVAPQQSVAPAPVSAPNLMQPNFPDAPAQPAIPQNAEGSVAWEATEYVHQKKSGLWLLGYVAAVLALGLFAFFVVTSITFVLLVVAIGVALGVLAFRPPRMLRYALNKTGLQINEKHYAFADFKSFGVVQDGTRLSAVLLPTKRLMLAVTIFFEKEQGEQIMDILEAHLPVEKIEESFVDRFIRRLHL